MNTLGDVVASQSAKSLTAGGGQKALPPTSVWPGTESQCCPGSGSFGLLVAGSTGHFASGLTREPKFEPSLSGFTLTLKTVPGGNVVPVIPWAATAAVPAISIPHSRYLPSVSLASDLWSGASMMMCSSAWFACGTNCLTTPVSVTTLVWSYIANE